VETAEPTWQPHQAPGRASTRSDLPETAFAFPRQRKEPLTDASHVRNAVARLDQVAGVSDADRALALANIQKAADYYDVDLSETGWQQASVHNQRSREETARRGAETRGRSGEAEEAALRAATTREKQAIAGKAARKAMATRLEREDTEGRREV
jgi:hypothetical protein